MIFRQIQNEEEFHAVRKNVLGGSELASIMGFSKWRTAFDLYCLKLGLVEKPPETKPMKWGKKLESIILDDFEQRHGRKVVRNLFAVSPEHDWISGNFDGVIFQNDEFVVAEIIDEDGDGKNQDRWTMVEGIPEAVVEAKSIGHYGRSEWGEEGTDSIPDMYALQVHQYMYVTGVRTCYLPVLFGGNEDAEFLVHFNPDVWRLGMDALLDFKRRLDEGDPPPITGAESTTNILKAMYPDSSDQFLEADGDMIFLVHRYAELRRAAAEHELTAKEAENQLRALLEEKAGLTGPDFKISYKRSKDRIELDLKGLKKDGLIEKYIPASDVEQYMKTVAGYRSWRPSGPLFKGAIGDE